MPAGGVEFTKRPGENSRSIVRHSPTPRGIPASGGGNHGGEMAAALAEVSAYLPETGEIAGHEKPALSVGRISLAPLQGGDQVVVFPIYALEPFRQIGTGNRSLKLLRYL